MIDSSCIFDTPAGKLLGDRGSTSGAGRFASPVATCARERCLNSKVAAARLSSRPTCSSADWKRSRDCGWRRLILQNRCCRISNDLATDSIQLRPATLAGIDVPDRLRN